MLTSLPRHVCRGRLQLERQLQAQIYLRGTAEGTASGSTALIVRVTLARLIDMLFNWPGNPKHMLPIADPAA